MQVELKQIEAWAPEQTEYCLPPEQQISTQSTLSLAATYDGASFMLARQVLASRLIYRVTALGLAGTQRWLFYQRIDSNAGNMGTALSKIASVTGAPGGVAATNVTVVFEQGLVEFQPGLLFVLVGRPSGVASTIRTFTNNATDLRNQNVDANTHPTTFTSAISAAAADPVTLNPLTQLVATTTDVIPNARLRA